MSGTAKPQLTVAQEVKSIIVNPGFDRAIGSCADGHRAKFITEKRTDGLNVPDVGPTCLGMLEAAADADLDPQQIEKFPDRQLLAYPARLAAEKGYTINKANAEKVLELYVRMGNAPHARGEMFGDAPVKNSDKKWAFTPGNAAIAGFIDTVKNGREGKSVPAITKTYEELLPALNACFNTVEHVVQNGTTMGPCFDAGVQGGALYLGKKAGAKSK